MKHSSIAAALLTLALALAAGCAGAKESDAIVEWAAQRAVPLDSGGLSASPAAAQAISAVIGNARVIGFAEFAHLQPECLAFRNELLKYLVLSNGVTAIAAETSFVDGIAVDDYVQGRTSTLPEAELTHSVFTWAPMPVAENRELIEWIRTYNARPETRRPVRFYGVDLTGYRPGQDLYQRARRTADAALAYAASLEPLATRSLSARLEPGLANFTKTGYATLSVQQRDALTAALGDLESLFRHRRKEWIEKTTALAYARALRSVVVARQHDADFRQDPDARWIGTARDAAMADNVMWALEQQGTDSRILLFASLNHLTKGPNEAYANEQLGARLRARLGAHYVAIGSYWDIKTQSQQPRSGASGFAEPLLATIARRVRHPTFLLDLRQRPADPRWMSQRDAGTFFDAMLFLDARVEAPEW